MATVLSLLHARFSSVVAIHYRYKHIASDHSIIQGCGWYYNRFPKGIYIYYRHVLMHKTKRDFVVLPLHK